MLCLAVCLPGCTLGLDTELVPPRRRAADASGAGDVAIDVALDAGDVSDAAQDADVEEDDAADGATGDADAEPADDSGDAEGDTQADGDSGGDVEADVLPGCRAAARAQVVDGSDWSTRLEAAVFDEITLDGSLSVGELSSYRWEVTERPAHSSADFGSDPEAASTRFVLDDWGVYQFTLRVWDESEDECASATVGVTVPDEPITIRLTWSTEQTDLDVHLLHPDGEWNKEPLDCFWRNRAPDWGVIGDPYDNPSLTQDDTDGLGPEEIVYEHPAGTPAEPVRYAVGVHVWRDETNTPSDATVIMRFGETIVSETVVEDLVNREFVHVGDLIWPDRTFEADGTRLPDIPNADPPH